MLEFVFAPSKFFLAERSYNSQIPLPERGYQFKRSFATINGHYLNELSKMALQISQQPTHHIQPKKKRKQSYTSDAPQCKQKMRSFFLI